METNNLARTIEKAMKAWTKVAGLGGDPSNERDFDLPVGLKVCCSLFVPLVLFLSTDAYFLVM